MTKFQKFNLAFQGGVVGMCLEYYFKAEPSFYPLGIAALTLVLILIKIFKDDN